MVSPVDPSSNRSCPYFLLLLDAVHVHIWDDKEALQEEAHMVDLATKQDVVPVTSGSLNFLVIYLTSGYNVGTC